MSNDGDNNGNAPWIRTFTGGRFYPTAPRRCDFNIIDIAHSLSNQCRFNGHTLKFYSVAEHSLILAEIMDTEGFNKETQQWALMHDAAEAYIGDIVRPLKTERDKQTENRILHELGLKLKLKVVSPDTAPQLPEIVDIYDTALLWREKEALLNPSVNKWLKPPLESVKVLREWEKAAHPSPRFYNMQPSDAKIKFLEKFEELFS